MKKLFILIFAIFFITSVNGQVLRSIARSATNQAKNSAENRASKEVDNQVDKGVNKFIDNLIKEDSTKNKENQTTGTTKNDTATGDNDQAPAAVSNFMKSLGVSNEAIPHKDEYKFTGQIIMTIQITDSDGKSSNASEYQTCFDEKSSDAMFKMKSQDNNSTTSTIIDQQNNCMLMLTESDGKKTGFATKFDPNSSQNTQTAETTKTKETSNTDDDCTPVKTGKTKSISGYNCSEYRCETKDAISIVWLTKEFSANNNKLFSHNAMGMKYKTEGLDGMAMQYENYSKSDKSSSVMTVKSIDMNKSSSFSTVGYQISGFNFNSKKK